MANPPDPDFSAFDSLPDGGGASVAQTAEAAASGVAAAVTRFGEKNKGSAVGTAAESAVEVTNAGRVLGVNIAIAQQAAKDLKAARDAWNKAAEGAKKADLDRADKAVTDARADLGKAAAAEEAQREKYNKAKEDTSAEGKLNAVALKSALDLAAAETAKAQGKLDKALETARKLHDQNRAACEALRAAMQRVADSLKKVDGSTCPPGMTPHTGTGDGYGAGSGSSNGSGTPAGKGTGSGAATPGGKSPAATPGKTPGSTPAAPTPETKTSSGGVDPETATLAAALSKAQQPQSQQAQQQMPTMPTVPQQATQAQQRPKTGEKGDGKATGAIDVDDLVRSGVLPASAAAGLAGLGLGGSSPSSSAPSGVAPAGPTTQLRPAGTPITGTLSSGPAPQTVAVPPTTGTSQTGLHTTSDVGGRSTPAATAFSATPAGVETKTSSATDTGQGTGTRTGGAPVAGAPGLGGMPVGGVAAPASGSRRGEGEERTRIEMYQSEEQYFLNGGDTRSEATPYTIAQNKPIRDDGPRRPGRAA